MSASIVDHVLMATVLVRQPIPTMPVASVELALAEVVVPATTHFAWPLVLPIASMLVTAVPMLLPWALLLVSLLICATLPVVVLVVLR